MKWIAFFVLAASLYAAPIASPDLVVDGRQVVSPNVGAAVVPTGLFQQFQICLNDNPADDPGNDQDFNDGCAMAEFGDGNVLTLSYIGGLTSATNYIGVVGQFGWVGPDVLEAVFFYTPGVETIFSGHVNAGLTAVYLSGSGGASNAPAGSYFYAECTLCPSGGGDGGTPTQTSVVPEPSSAILMGLGLVSVAIRSRG